MIERTLFNADHEAFRDSFRKFVEKEIAPHHEAWEEQGYVDRAVWSKAGENGFLCMTLPEAHGGSEADKLYSVVQMEEIARSGFSGIGFGLHSEIVAPYILHYGTDEQKKKYLPRLATGEMVGAIAMSEPAAGSDLQGVKSTAIKQADGSYLLNGSKTFITNGWHADLVIVVAKTDPNAGAKGTSLLLVERGMPGFEKGKRLKKLGMKAQDTSELFFRQCEGAGGQPARRPGDGRPRLHLPDGATALGAAADRHRRGGRGAGRDRLDGCNTPGTARSSARPWPSTRTRATRWPNCRPRCRWRACSSTSAASSSWTASSTPPPPAWPSTGVPTCSAR